MAETKDKHDHDHDHGPGVSCCGGGHAHDDGGPEYTDPAGEHLASALRLSFRLLGVAMVLGVLAFLAVGFRSVGPGEVAIKSVFGKVVGVTSSGLAYNWPAPIGKIDVIKVGEESVEIGDFWMREAAADVATRDDLRKRTVPPGGLVPGLDGALLTGDRNQMHMRMQCKYTKTRTYELPWNAPELAGHPVAEFVRKSPDAGETVAAAIKRAEDENAGPVVMSFLDKCDPTKTLLDAVSTARFASPIPPALYYRLNMVNGPETIKEVVCEAAIRAAAVRTADGLQRTDRNAFEHDTMTIAQQRLDELKSGIEIRSVKVTYSTWPLATLAAYAEAQSAVQQAEAAKSQARGEAANQLNSTAGAEASRILVGEIGTSGKADPNTNLIGQYNAASGAGDTAKAASLLARIDDVLSSEMTIGKARKLISEAGSYRANTIETVKRRVADFEQRLVAYEKNPSFAMNRWWDEVREAVLSNPTAEKHYITEGDQKIVLKLNRDLDIIRETQRALLRWQAEQKSSNSSPPSPDESSK